MWARSGSDDEELLEAVQSLRSRLRRTEESLQSVGAQLNSTGTKEHPDRCCEEAAELTLKDPVHLNCSSRCSASCPKTSDLVPTAFDKAVEENERLKEKLNDLHELNASLASQNHHLRNRIETTNLELVESKTRISYLESTLGAHLVSIPKLEEQIATLEAEVSARDKILRDAEDKLEQSQKAAVERESMMQRYKKDCENLKIELIERNKQGKRAEQQRNEALLNAEELTRVFQKFKENITERFEKVQAEGARLENDIINCEKEREKLNEKCVSYRKHLDIQDEQLR